MAVKFLSKEWESAMQKALEEEFSSKGLVSCVFTQIITNCPDGTQKWTRTEIEKGKYVSYTVGEGEPVKDYVVAAAGDYEIHKGCVAGKIDGSQCIVTGQMKLKGNIAKGMSMLGTYSRLEEVEQSIEIED